VKEAAPPRARRLRRLSDEEIALWTEVALGVARRRGASLPAPSRPPAPNPAPAPAPPPVETRAPRQPAAAPPLAKIDRRLRRKLARGRGDIDDAIDLHGLTQAEAHQALRGFLRHAQARGARLVIVVTGKGGPLGDDEPWDRERGVLRRLAPHWLREPDLRSIVLGFEEAGRAHGGSGALYVRLRRR
jgi:DNA-nicking Smr family endonuclease